MISLELFHLLGAYDTAGFNNGLALLNFGDDRRHGFDGMFNFFITFSDVVDKIGFDSRFKESVNGSGEVPVNIHSADIET